MSRPAPIDTKADGTGMDVPSMWDWIASPISSLKSSNPASRNASMHGGNNFGSAGGRKNSVSFNDLSKLEGRKDGATSPTDMYGAWPSPPPSNAASLHGGNAFGPGSASGAAGGAGAPQIGVEEMHGTMRRNSMSFVWDWAWGRGTPPASRGVSLHGGNAFGGHPGSRNASAHGGSEFGNTPQQQQLSAGQSEASSGGGGMRRNSMSFLWDWSQKSNPGSEAGSRANSLHGGSAFAPKDGKDGETAGGAEATSAPSIWDWGWSRKTPPASRGASLHGGNAFAGLEKK